MLAFSVIPTDERKEKPLSQ